MTIPNGFKPMLAATCTDTSKIKYPVLGSVKLDGIRAVIFGGVAYSRSLKPIRNVYIQDWVALYAHRLEGLDGEFIVGSPNAVNVFQVTTSGVMSEDGRPDFTFFVFDSVSDKPFRERIFNAYMKKVPRLLILNQFEISNEEELLEHEAKFLSDGYEGLMVKDPNGLYKFGRSTEKSGQLLKVKRFVDEEFEIVGFEEKMHNTNEAKIDALGHTERSTSKEGLVPAGTLGALIVKTKDNRQFGVGSGFDDATRKEIWDNKEYYLGKLAKVKYFPVGIKDLPRFPVYLGIRSEDDL